MPLPAGTDPESMKVMNSFIDSKVAVAQFINALPDEISKAIKPMNPIHSTNISLSS